MATAAQSLQEWPQPIIWLRNFLREELAPYPGRGAVVARMVLASSIVMILTMTFRMPFGAYGSVYALTISRENPEATIRAVKTILISFAVSVMIILGGAILFSGEPLIRLVWVIATFFMMFFALSALSNYSAANRFGYLVAITTPLWDRQMPANLKVQDTLWAVGVMSLASVITAAIEVIFHSLKPGDDLTGSLARRLENIVVLLRSYAQGEPDKSCQQKLIRFSMLGTSRMRRDLQRSSYTEQYAEKMGAVVAFTGRLVDIVANLTHFPSQISSEDRGRLQDLAENISAIRDDLLNNRIPQLVKPMGESGAGESGALETIPLLREMEQSVSLIADVFTGSRTLGAYALPDEPAEPPKRLFVPDAFTNPEHIRFCIRGGCAATICYLTYNLIAWPGISTAVVTCFLTAMTTIGSSRQKQVLRFAGALVGGAIGMGAQIFILPSVDSITGFLILFAAVTILAAWFATSGPRLSYFGVQIAVAFYLVNLLEFKFQTSLAVAWDRIAGILLGLFVMWLVFDQLWGAPAITQMLRTFTSTLRLVAQFHREPISPDIRVAIQRTFSLRNSINNNLERLRLEADAVLFEFGRTREHDIALRRQILNWQIQLRMVFVARIALLKYRLRLPGFELPTPIQNAQKAFDNHLAATLESMADRLGGKEGRPPEGFGSNFEDLKKVVDECCPVEPPQELAAQLRTFLPLSHRIELLVRSLNQEI